MAEERKRPKMKLRIVEQKGTCAFGHKVGQEYDITRCTPEGVCQSAYHCAYPAIYALRFGGSLPWEKDKNKNYIACPDPFNPVVMEIVREEE